MIYTIKYVHCQALTSIVVALIAFPVLNFWVLRWCIHEPKDIQTYLADRSTVIYCHSWGFANYEDTKCHLSLLVQLILLCALSMSVCAQARLIILIPCNLYGSKQVWRPFWMMRLYWNIAVQGPSPHLRAQFHTRDYFILDSNCYEMHFGTWIHLIMRAHYSEAEISFIT